MPKKERLTFEQLRAEPVFRDLTPRQQKMIETFIASNGDRLQAVQSAYNAKSAEVARVMAYEFFASHKVVACLTAYFQDDPLEVFKRDLRRAMTSKKLTVAQVQAMKIYCDVHGWGSKSLPDLHGRDAKPDEDAAVSETPRPDRDVRVPAGATPLADDAGVIRGYRLPSGDYVRLVDGAAEVHVRE
jgi:hypothetical protein